MPVERRLVRAADGTRIYAERHGTGSLTPLLCLPGLTRNGRDFEPVVDRYSVGRAVITIDFRGRGRSDAAADPLTYRPDVELQDTLAVLDSFEVLTAALLGTSRGGIVGLLMAASASNRLAGLCLNDIGPHIEAGGLLRIMGYVGVDVSFPSWEEAAAAYGAAAPGFENVAPEAWLKAVRRAYTLREDGRVTPYYDMKLSTTLPPASDVTEGKVPELWGLLPSLATKPLTVLRGAGSDLLSTHTMDRLRNEVRHADTVEVPERGHVPFLDEPEVVAALDRWLARIDETTRPVA